MAFTRIRTIKGRQYWYLEERWREGGKVRSRSISLGPMDEGPRPGFLKRLFPPSYGFDWAKIEREELHRIQTAEAKRDEALKGLHDAYGMIPGPAVPVPVEKAPARAAAPTVDQAKPMESSEPAPTSAGNAEVDDATEAASSDIK